MKRDGNAESMKYISSNQFQYTITLVKREKDRKRFGNQFLLFSSSASCTPEDFMNVDFSRCLICLSCICNVYKCMNGWFIRLGWSVLRSLYIYTYMPLEYLLFNLLNCAAVKLQWVFRLCRHCYASYSMEHGIVSNDAIIWLLNEWFIRAYTWVSLVSRYRAFSYHINQINIWNMTQFIAFKIRVGSLFKWKTTFKSSKYTVLNKVGNNFKDCIKRINCIYFHIISHGFRILWYIL